MRNRTVALLVSFVAALALSGCGGSDASSGGGGGSSDKETGTLNVLAAASLTETFTSLAKDLEADHPGVTVKLAFDSSATLAEQVTQGAPADVLATADEATMQTVVDAGGTTSCRWLVAKTVGSPSVPSASTTVCMVSSSAVASTSAGAPCVTCSASVALESKASLTSTPGWSASKSFARVV